MATSKPKVRYTLLTMGQLDTIDAGHSVYAVVERRLRSIHGYIYRLEPIFNLNRLAPRKNL